MDIKKQIYLYGATAIISSLATCFLMAKYAPLGEKIVEVETIVPVQDQTAVLKIQSLQNELDQQKALMDEDQKMLQALFKKHNVTGSEKQIKEAMEKAKWLAIAMYRECRGCNKVETLLIGNAMILHLKEGKLGNTMEKVVKYKTPGGGYFLEFAANPASFYVDSAYKNVYYDMALSLIQNSTDTENIRRKYNDLFTELGLKHVNAVYWCNQSTSRCTFHNKRVAQGCFSKVPKIDLRDGYKVPIDPTKDVSQHTVYVNNLKCRL